MLQLFSHFNAVCGQKVLFLLKKQNLSFNYHSINLRAGEQHQKDFLALNEKGQVPVLKDDNRIVTESTDICIYIDKYYCQNKFSYFEVDKQKHMTKWMNVIDKTIHPACSSLTWSIAIRPEMQKKSQQELIEHFDAIPCPERKKRQMIAYEAGLTSPDLIQAIQQHKRLIQDIEKQLAHTTYLVDEKLSLADICVLPYIVRLEMLACENFWQDTPNVTTWLDNLKTHSAFQQTFSTLYPQGFKKRWYEYGKLAQRQLR